MTDWLTLRYMPIKAPSRLFAKTSVAPSVAEAGEVRACGAVAHKKKMVRVQGAGLVQRRQVDRGWSVLEPLLTEIPS